MPEITVSVPMTGFVERVEKNRHGRIRAVGDNRPIGIEEMMVLVGSTPARGVRTEVLNRDLSDGTCTLLLAADDAAWLTTVQIKLAALDDDPERIRTELQKFRIGVDADDKPQLVYDEKNLPDAQIFDQISLTPAAFGELQDILQSGIDLT